MLLDDFTRVSVVEVLKTKSQVAEAIIKVLTQLENQTHYAVKAIRSDNGTEFTNSVLQTWCQQKGIEFQPAPPYTPQMNGRAERLQQTLLKKARCMLAQAQAPPAMWPHVITAANYLKNRTRTGKEIRATPIERLTGKVPDVSNFRVWGCKVSIRLPDRQIKNKLEAVATVGAFVGYACAHCFPHHFTNGLYS